MNCPVCDYPYFDRIGISSNSGISENQFDPPTELEKRGLIEVKKPFDD